MFINTDYKFLFSIIIPCYNQQDYLNETLESVLAQTYPNWECLLIDDGSTDETQGIAKEWTKLDSRFQLFTKQNGGLSSARNYGIERSNGNYLLFLDSDDIIYQKYLEKAYEKLIKSKAEILLAGFNFFQIADFSKDGLTKIAVNRFNFFKELSKSAVLPVHCYVIAKTLVQKIGHFDETLQSAEDWDFWARAGKLFTSLETLNYVAASYRMRPKSMSRNASVMLETSIKVAKRIRKIDSRIQPNQRISKEPIEPVIIRFLIIHCGSLLFSGKKNEACELFQATLAQYNLNLQPQDFGNLISYLVFQENFNVEAKRDFWSKHISYISEFLLFCESNLKKRGFYRAAMTYLTAVYLHPENMSSIIPYIRTKDLLLGGMKTICFKTFQKFNINY